MPVKRRVSKARAQLSELAYKYLTDAPLSEEEKAGFDYSALEFNQYDSSINADTETLWKRHGPEILKEWIAKHAGTRPICWWRFDSGLQRRKGGIEVNGKIIGRNVVYSLRDSIPEDQRGWLAERGLLQEDE